MLFAYEHRRIMMKVVTDLLCKYEWEVLPLAPNGPDICPPDFELFPRLKGPMRWHRVSSVEEVTVAVTRAIRGLKKSGNLNWIVYLPKRWDVVIEKQGATYMDCKQILPKIKHTFK